MGKERTGAGNVFAMLRQLVGRISNASAREEVGSALKELARLFTVGAYVRIEL